MRASTAAHATHAYAEVSIFTSPWCVSMNTGSTCNPLYKHLWLIFQGQIQQQHWESSSFYLLYLASPFQISVWIHYQFVMQTEVSYLLLCSIRHVQTWENLFAIEQWFQLRLSVFLLLQWQNLAAEFSAFWFICTVLYGDALYLPRDIQSFYATLEACPSLALSWSPPAVTCISNRLEQGGGKSQKEDLLHWAS